MIADRASTPRLPSAPAQYSAADQNELRRMLEQILAALPGQTFPGLVPKYLTHRLETGERNNLTLVAPFDVAEGGMLAISEGSICVIL